VNFGCGGNEWSIQSVKKPPVPQHICLNNVHCFFMIYSLLFEMCTMCFVFLDRVGTKQSNCQTLLPRINYCEAKIPL